MVFQPNKIKSPKNWRQGRRRRRKTRLNLNLGHLIKSLTLLGFLAAILGVFFVAWLTALFARDLPSPNRLLERKIPVSTKIYDRTGEVLLYDIHGAEKRTLVELDNISNYAKWAVVAAEDKDFYQHGGFDFKAILRAVLMDVLRGGKFQGGSTITQQFVKNAILSREKTISRKLKELILAYRIEKSFSKDEILKMYFNEIPYGSTIYGIEAASLTFFNKKAKDLDLVESAILATIPKAPSYYSPYGNHLDDLEGRARYIMGAMAEEGYITNEELENSKKEDVLKKIQPKQDNLKAPHFSLLIKDLLTQKYGAELVESGGLKITATLDWKTQQIAEEEVRKGAENNAKKYNGHNAALVAMDNKTGQILALVGSRDYFGKPAPEGCKPGVDCQFDPAVNVALRPRQPGSSFKPIVYATAFSKGYTPETVLYDVVTTFKAQPKDYTPHNYDDKERGPVTIRQALAGSLNIPAVKTLYLAGVEQVLNLAEKMGYTTLKDRSRFGLSLVLGGAEVKLLEQVVGFSVFANEGEYVPPSFILKIEDQNGRVLEEWQAPKTKKTLETIVVRQVTGILSDNPARTYIFGSNSALFLGDRPVAAKTGTTNDWRDGWTIGFTPSLVAGVWVGNNDNTPMKQKADGVYTAGPIWNAFMKRVLEKKPIETFTPPEKEDIQKPILRGEGVGEIKLVIDKISGKLATEWTPLEAREEKTYKQPHSILYFVNKDDPRGPTPTNPQEDEQFGNWEQAVFDWAQKQGFTSESPPTEFDDIHKLADKPTVTIKTPTEGSIIDSANLSLEFDANVPRGIKITKVYFDDTLISETTTPTYIFNLVLPSPTTGPHTIKVKVFDDILNEGEDSKIINCQP